MPVQLLVPPVFLFATTVMLVPSPLLVNPMVLGPPQVSAGDAVLLAPPLPMVALELVFRPVTLELLVSLIVTLVTSVPLLLRV